jgi:hypothetical protein
MPEVDVRVLEEPTAGGSERFASMRMAGAVRTSFKFSCVRRTIFLLQCGKGLIISL